jgi:hypothetical protein
MKNILSVHAVSMMLRLLIPEAGAFAIDIDAIETMLIGLSQAHWASR